MTGTFLRRTAAAAATATALVVLAGCGSSSSSTATAPESTTASTPSSGGSSSPSSSSSPTSKVVITIKDFKFSGASTVKAGATITVTNEDSTAHTLTADDSSAGFDVKIDAGKSATFTAPAKAGDYPYHCTYHSNMHGSLTVK